MTDQLPSTTSLVDPRFLGDYPGACVGDWDLFDPPEPNEDRERYQERSALARKVCNYCPIHSTCAEVAAELPARDRAGFTYAATTYNSAGAPLAFHASGRAA